MRRRTVRRTLALIALALCATLLMGAGCAPQSQVQDRTNTEEQQQIYARNQPVPRFEWSQTRDTLVQIYTLENEARPTYTVFQADGTGAVTFMCPSRGYAIPADAQLTNPLQPGYSGYAETYVIEQPEPNGVYSSKNTDGTYVLCIRPGGEVVPVYTEQKVTTYPFPVEWDAEKGLLVDTGQPSSSTITVRTSAPAPAPAR